MSEPWRTIEIEIVHWLKEQGVGVRASHGVPHVRVTNSVGSYSYGGYEDVNLMELAKRLAERLEEAYDVDRL